MDVLKISSQYYIVQYKDDSKQSFRIVDGPYPEESQAISMGRIRDI